MNTYISLSLRAKRGNLIVLPPPEILRSLRSLRMTRENTEVAAGL